MFGNATADANGVAVFAIDFDTRLNSVSAWSRNSAWRYILPTAERSSDEDGVQSEVRRRVVAVNSWCSVRAIHRDDGRNHTVRNTGSGEKKTDTSRIVSRRPGRYT